MQIKIGFIRVTTVQFYVLGLIYHTVIKVWLIRHFPQDLHKVVSDTIWS